MFVFIYSVLDAFFLCLLLYLFMNIKSVNLVCKFLVIKKYS
jgi:hypothetical protein